MFKFLKRKRRGPMKGVKEFYKFVKDNRSQPTLALVDTLMSYAKSGVRRLDLIALIETTKDIIEASEKK